MMTGLPCLVISLNRKFATVNVDLSAIALASGHFCEKICACYDVHVSKSCAREWAYEVYSNLMPRTVNRDGMECGSWFFQLLVDPLTCITCLNIRVNGCSHVAPVVPAEGWN